MREEKDWTEISLSEVCYLAGIIDGEGSINMALNPKSGRNYYRLLLNVTNNSRELIEWLHWTFGDITHTNYIRYNGKDWTASGKQVQELLKLVLPYLIIKKPQAELALTLNIAPYGGASRWSYSKEEEEYRGYVYREMSRLNGVLGNKGRYTRTKSMTLKGGECLAIQS